MAAIVYWHNDKPPILGCLPIEFVRAVDGSTLVENELCEGYYKDSDDWYDCILLHLDKSRFLFRDINCFCEVG